MKNGSKIIIGILAVIALLGVLFIAKYNNLVSLEEEVNKQYAVIDTQLQRRLDLIPNLVATVKGFAIHEEEIINNLSEARSKLLSSNNPSEAAQANQLMSDALTKLLVVVENYPELKANENFIALQDELSGTENRISVARIDYNNAVQDYNKSIKLFPNNIIAGIFGFESKDYFEASENADEVPNVSFE